MKHSKVDSVHKAALDRLVARGLVEKSDAGYRITDKGTAVVAAQSQQQPQPVFSEKLNRGA